MTVIGFNPVSAINKNVSGLMSRQEGSGDWLGITPRTHTLETHDPKILARDTEGYLAGRTIDSLMGHKLGHLIEGAYHVNGLELAERAYENVFRKRIGKEKLLKFIKSCIVLCVG